MGEQPWPTGLDGWTDDEIAGALLDSHASRITRRPLSTVIELDLERAYRIQRRCTERRLERGERVVGWKLGYTSAAMREQMGIDAPNFGPLFDEMCLANGDDVGGRFTQPRVEPEIAVVLASDVDAPHQVRASIGEAFACLEVVDSVYTDYRFTLADNTADGSSAAGFVLGDLLSDGWLIDLTDVDVEFEGWRATGAAASGDPLVGVEWLVGELAAMGRSLRAGDIVLTGGLTSALELAPGQQRRAVFAGDSYVSIRRS